MNSDVKFSLGQGFTAADLQTMQFPPIRWIVPQILPEGLTILAGKPKVGKSWLALDCALAVAIGGSVLGRECEPGPVLCLALEDNQRRLQRRLNRIGPDQQWPDTLQFYTSWPRLNTGGEKDIRKWIGHHKDARLVIVDTLAPVRPEQRTRDSAHAGDYAALRGLHQIANDTGVGVLVIHHLRKMDAEDPFDTVSGSTGLTGAADSTLILTRRDSDGGVILYGRGRDLEEFECGLEFDADTCRWRDLGDPVQAFASDTRSAIFDTIRAGFCTPGDITRETEIDAMNVRQTLKRMVRSGDLKKEKRGVYSIPSDPLSQESQCHNDTPESDNVTDVTSPTQTFTEFF